MRLHRSSVYCLWALTPTQVVCSLTTLVLQVLYQLLLIRVISNYICSVSSQSWLSQLQQNALQPSTDGLGSYYTVLSCLYVCDKDFPTLKQLLCVNQLLLFSRSFYVYFPVLIWALCSWPVDRVDSLFLPTFLFTCMWFIKFYVGIEYWISSRGYFTLSATDIIKGCTFGKCECSKIPYLWFDVDLFLNYWL